MTSPLRWIRDPGVRLGRCLFLDRDGVINEQIKGGYVMRWEDFRWIDGAVPALARAAQAGLPLVLVTNQSCIGRGLVARQTIEKLLSAMTAVLDEAEAPLAAWYCCPHAPDEGCSCRKPLPGMLEAAAVDLSVDLRASYLVGDSESDIAAAEAVGCPAWRVTGPASLAAAVDDILAQAAQN